MIKLPAVQGAILLNLHLPSESEYQLTVKASFAKFMIDIVEALW